MIARKKKNLEFFLSLPYRIELYPAAEGGFAAAIPELPGCITQGETQQEALEMIQDAKEAWIETALEEGLDIPEPIPDSEEFSGKFNLRIPLSLHRDLVRRATKEKVSLNMLVTYLLSANMGCKAKMR